MPIRVDPWVMPAAARWPLNRPKVGIPGAIADKSIRPKHLGEIPAAQKQKVKGLTPQQLTIRWPLMH